MSFGPVDFRAEVRRYVKERQELVESEFRQATRKQRRVQEHPDTVKREALRDLVKLGVEAFLELRGIAAKDGLEGTPARVVKAWQEMTNGYDQDPASILSVTFPVAYDEIVIVRGIRFTSLCEHHVLPFVGTMDVGYLPGERVVGLSKIPRLVLAFAHRLQIQERLTAQVADAMMEHLGALGVGVICRAQHECMGCRGVRQPDASMITSAMKGRFLDVESARAEFLRLVEGGSR